MTAAISNATQEICPICQEDYKKNEIKNVGKVAELVCGHSYHICCISTALKNQEKGLRNLTCCYCNQVFASRAEPCNPLINQEVFQKKIRQIENEYDYDTDVTESISPLSTLYSKLHNFNEEESKYSKSYRSNLITDFVDFVNKNEAIEEELKESVLQFLNEKIFDPMQTQDFFFDTLESQEVFEWVFRNDATLTALIPYLSVLYNPLHDLCKKAFDNSQEHLSEVARKSTDFIIKDTIIEERLKETAIRILGAMYEGNLTLRSAEQEGKRWLGSSYEDLPDRIKNNGILVRYEDVRMRISAQHLIRVIQDVSLKILWERSEQRAKDLCHSINSGLRRFGVFAAGSLAKEAFNSLFS